MNTSPEQNGGISVPSTSSVSEYKSRCRDYILNGFLYPGMYFNSLEELELILFGHSLAHEQIGLISRSQSFNMSFSDWLYEEKKISCASGWPMGLSSLNNIRDCTSPDFKSIVMNFLNEWKGADG